MALSAGSRLGPYEILSAIGGGGMGEVYKARDIRLDRIVAIKVLPPHLASDPEFRERFDREARSVAALNHPHICALHDIGTHDGIDFLVMEYCDGATLARRLEKGALPLADALKIAIEIADALDKAHRHGITHRDLKPGNIMLTAMGSKLLDFGLAKTRGVGRVLGPAGVAGPESPAYLLTSLPTALPNLTARGTILGTFQYMAPEQIEGQEADARTDIFGFGAVLYEMLTGKKAFEGKTQASLIGAILEREPPPVSSVQPLTPPALDRIVKKCLAKDPEARWHSAHDLHDELTWIAAAGSAAAVAPPAVRRGSRERITSWTVAAVCAVAAMVLGIFYLRSTRPTDAHPVRFSISPPQNAVFSASLTDSIPAVSPDGRRLAFVATRGRTPIVWIRSLEASDAQLLPGTEGAASASLFWSPDSRTVGFVAAGVLKTIEASGGPTPWIVSS